MSVVAHFCVVVILVGATVKRVTMYTEREREMKRVLPLSVVTAVGGED